MIRRTLPAAMRVAAALFLLTAVTALAVSGAAAQDPDDPSPASEVSLVSDVAWVRPGEPFTVAVRIRMDPGWHTYWTNAGDSGLPLELEWDLPEGFEASHLRWPVPHRIPVAPLMTYGYEDEVLALAELTPPANLRAGGTVTLGGRADYLVCAELCIPATEEFALTLPVRVNSVARDPQGREAIAAARVLLPELASGWRTRAWTTETGYVLEVTPPPGVAFTAPYLYADSTGVVEHAQPQRVARVGSAMRLAIPRSEFALEDAKRLGGILVADASRELPAWTVQAVIGTEPADVAGAPDVFAHADVQETGGLDDPDGATPFAADPERADAGLGFLMALAFAFLGGLLLNLMPCVFPVLSMKVLGFMEHAGGDVGRARRHGFAFAAGVLLSFWLLAGTLLALRAGGESIGWGFQLQSPTIVALLALVVFTLALGMSGLFEIGLGLTRLGAAGAGRGYRDSVLTGGLVVVVATPCTAPFMGAGLGYALVQPPLQGLAVFTALALGLAAPYVVLANAPGLLRRLPRPGAWMETLKQALAFPLYATVVWLVWVFGRQAGVDAVALLLLGLTLVALAAWLARLAQRPAAASARRLPAVATGLAAIGIAFFAASVAAAPTSNARADARWEPYSAERLATLREEARPVFVDFTAAWCLTCQVNERIALNSAAARRAFAEADVALMKADWTSRDPDITQALQSFGRSGVPLYVLYPASGTTPEILPTLLTPGIVVDAVRRSSRLASTAPPE